MAHDTLNEVTQGRYRWVQDLGHGGSAHVTLVEDVGNGSLWAAKELALQRTPDWKTWELFERAAAVTAHLEHQGIARFRELVRHEDASDPRLWIIEEYVPGQTLRELVESGRHFELEEVGRLARDLLAVLAYIHGRTPPIVHRDVKPSNVLVRASPDDASGPGVGAGVVLIDFGSVQQVVARHTLGPASTIVGTIGYMPPEQFMGQAVPASDLYGLGATLLYVLTGQEPSDFPVRDMRLDFGDALAAYPQPLAAVVRRLLDPRPEGRPPDAATAARALGAALHPAVRRRTAPQLPALGPPAPAATAPGPGHPHASPADSGLLATGAMGARGLLATGAMGARDLAAAQAGTARDAGDRALACPGCGATMELHLVGHQQIPVDVCPACQGMWLDTGELGALLTRPVTMRSDLPAIRRRVAALGHRPDAVVYRRCPLCGASMHRRNFGRVSGVVVDECGGHGAFLDAGELEAIQRFVDAGGMELADEARRAQDAEALRHKASMVNMQAQMGEPVVWGRSMGARARGPDFVDLFGALGALWRKKRR